jgi:alpha-L-fucosidase
MDVGPKRDLVGDLSKAVKDEGMRMGLYYSSIEWESSPTARRPNGWWLPEKVHEKYRIPEKEFVGMINQQLREIVNQYEPSLIFADGGEWDGDADYWGTKQFLEWLYFDSPVKDDVVVNDRLSKESVAQHGDYYSSEYQDTEKVGSSHPWEESRGMGGSYGFNRAENIEDYRTSSELIHELVDIVARGGNLLLNVGPTSDGRIPVMMQDRLRDIGNWLKINGECIYGTRPNAGVRSSIPEVRFTQKNGSIYAICLKWPGQNLVLDGVDASSSVKVKLLGSSQSLEVRKNGNRILIETPRLDPNTFTSVHAWVFKLSFAE